MSAASELAVGLVGPGRTRNGLGPYLARHLAGAGARVVAVSGRTPDRTRVAAASLAEALGHEVVACAGVDELVAYPGLAALVVASPYPHHLAALRAALRAGLPTLCEKPLVDLADTDAGLLAVHEFAARRLPLLENCQWPLTLPGFAALHPLPPRPSRLEMRLSPAGHGRDMVLDSLSHALSLAQALWRGGDEPQLRAVSYAGAAADAEAVTVHLELAGASDASLEVALHLARHPSQPRPAWYAIDGARVDREVRMPRYHWLLRAGDRSHSVGDPQAELVYRFVQSLREPDVARIRAEAAAIHLRARLFAAVCRAWPASG